MFISSHWNMHTGELKFKRELNKQKIFYTHVYVYIYIVEKKTKKKNENWKSF